MEKKRFIKSWWAAAIPAIAILIMVAAFLLSDSESSPGEKEAAAEMAEYTYENSERELPAYETDIFTIDGELNEEIYGSLRWWAETYSEGSGQDGVDVRVTSYLGENGVYFVFDVDDDNVHVNPSRASWENSGITLYLAEEDSHDLDENVWEIEILPNNYINAKRYMGGYYFGTVIADGFENQPFVRTAAKGGDINTDACEGYVMESYFPYAFLLGEDWEKPERFSVNIALLRSYSADAGVSRDVYYNFGENIKPGYSWPWPETWWSFTGKGLDSVDLVLEAGEGGGMEYRNDYIARYLTDRVAVIPDEGCRITSLCLDTNGQKNDVTNQIVYEDGVNYIKLLNVTDDVRLLAEFEKVPGNTVNISGTVSIGGKAPSEEARADLEVRYLSGGIAYTSAIGEDGSYTLQAPEGKGVLEAYSKSGFVAKREEVTVESENIRQNLNLSSDEYGNSRVMELPRAQVMGNRERVFNGEKMTGNMSGTFAYDFTLTYDGKLLKEDGTPVDDPTFGEYDNQYTSINLEGRFTDESGVSIDNSDFRLQFMSWEGDGLWTAKLWLDGQSAETRIGIDELGNFGTEEGVAFRLIFADSRLGLYQLDGKNLFKVLEIEASSTPDRYLRSIDFFAERCVNHSIWKAENQSLALGRSESSYSVAATIASADGVAEFRAKEAEEDMVRTSLNWDEHLYNGSVGFGGTLCFPGVLDENGRIVYRTLETGFWCDTSRDGADWYQYNIFLIGDGSHYYLSKTGKIKMVELNREQLRLLGTTGLNVASFADGARISYMVDDGYGEMVIYGDLYEYNEDQPWFSWPDTSNGAHILHEGKESYGWVMSRGTELYTGMPAGMNAASFVNDVLGWKFKNYQMLNPVTHTFRPGSDDNWFIYNHTDVKQDCLYGFKLKADAADKDGAIQKDLTVNITIKGWANDEYFAWMPRLRIADDSAYFIWSQGVDPWGSSHAQYFLNEAQLAELAGDGLDIYLEYEHGSDEMKLWVDNGDGDIVLASTFKDSIFRKGTGVDVIQNTYGYAVECPDPEATATIECTGCVTWEAGNFETAVKELFGKDIAEDRAQPELVRIGSDTVYGPGGKVELDYGDFNIGGGWFDGYSVKLKDAVDAEGNVLKTCTAKLYARLQGDEYYGQAMNLILSRDGKVKLQMPNYGGSWESYYYTLTKEQAAQLGKDGLKVYLNHSADAHSVTVYLGDGQSLVPVRTFTYGSGELWAKGYSLEYEGSGSDSVEMTAACYKHDMAVQEALNRAYEASYTVKEGTVLIYSDFVNREQTFSGSEESETMTTEHRWVGNHSLYRFNLRTGAVDAGGNVTEPAKAEITTFANAWKYQFNTVLELSASASTLSVQEGEPGGWVKHTYVMNPEQLRKLAGGEGLNLYISYENDEIAVYIEEGEGTLVKALSFRQEGLSLHDSRLTWYQSGQAFTAEETGYTYENGTFAEAVEAIYGKKYSQRERTALEELRVTVGTLAGTGETIDVDYDPATNGLEFVKGSWLDHFSVRLGGAVDGNGRILETSETNLVARVMGADYYQESMTLCLTEDGGYLKMDNYGGAWESYCYRLTPSQLARLSGGLDIYVGHAAEENRITVYLADGDGLVNVRSFIYGEAGLEAKGYFVSTTAASPTILAECVTYEGTDIVSGLNTLYGQSYTEQTDTFIYRNYLNAAKTFENAENPEGEYRHYEGENAVTVTAPVIYRFNLKSGAVNADGSIAGESNLALQGFDANWEQAVSMNVRLQADGGYLDLNGYAIDWNAQTYTLSTEQLRKLADANGLNLYVSYDKDSNFAVYLEESAGQVVQLLNVNKSGIAFNEIRPVYAAAGAPMTVEATCYTYVNGESFIEAAGTIYNKNYTINTNAVLYRVVASGGKTFTAEDSSEYANWHEWMWGDHLYEITLKNPGVDSSGTVTSSSEMVIRPQRSDWWGATITTLHLDTAGSYLQFQEGYNEWKVLDYYYLTAEQLQQLAGDGLKLYIRYQSDVWGQFAVYIPDGDRLVKAGTFNSPIDHSENIDISGPEGASVNMTLYAYSAQDFLTDLNAIKGAAYTEIAEPEGITAPTIAQKSGNTGDGFTGFEQGELGMETFINGNYIFHYRLLSPDLLDTDGNIKRSSDISIALQGQIAKDWAVWREFGFTINLKRGANNGADITTYRQGVDEWNWDTSNPNYWWGDYYWWGGDNASLTAAQVKALATTGLDIFFVHNAGSGAVSVYAGDTKLVDITTRISILDGYLYQCKISHNKPTDDAETEELPNVQVEAAAYYFNGISADEAIRELLEASGAGTMALSLDEGPEPEDERLTTNESEGIG